MKIRNRKPLISLFFKGLFFFSLSGQAAIGKEYKSIKVPSFMRGAEVVEGQSSAYLEYGGGVVVNKKVEALKKGKIELFIKKLWGVYKTGDKASFKKLFTDAGLAQLSELSAETFEKEWQALKEQNSAILNSYFDYQGGTVINWTIGKIPRGLFVVNKNGKIKIDAFKAKKDDKEFHNRGLFFTYMPTEPRPAKIVAPLRPEEGKYTLTVEVDEERPRLHVFKRAKDKWKAVVSLADNEVGKGRFDDSDSRSGVISVKFEKEHFTGNEVELLVLKSNFPMESYPFSLEREESFKIPSH